MRRHSKVIARSIIYRESPSEEETPYHNNNHLNPSSWLQQILVIELDWTISAEINYVTETDCNWYFPTLSSWLKDCKIRQGLRSFLNWTDKFCCLRWPSAFPASDSGGVMGGGLLCGGSRREIIELSKLWCEQNNTELPALCHGVVTGPLYVEIFRGTSGTHLVSEHLLNCQQ